MDPIVILVAVAAVLVLVGLGYVARRGQKEGPAPRPAAPRAEPARPELARSLAKTRRSLALRAVFSRSSMDREFWEGMEEALIAADVGAATASEIVGRVREASSEGITQARPALRRELTATLGKRDRRLRREGRPAVFVMVGVNGVGKTTTIAKLAHHLERQGLTSLLSAADTFRAGATAQLRTWGERVGSEVVGGQEGSDPAAVAFDSYQAARARARDVVIVDTAGRLHSKHNLMAELQKVVRVLEREAGKVDEVLLVLDATTGQNGIAQVREFTEAVGVTGIVLTKLDGTARGGIVVAVEQQLGVPVKLVGVGEGVDDLLPFDPEEFVVALLAEP